MLGREIGCCYFMKLLAYCGQSLACAGKDQLTNSSWSHVTSFCSLILQLWQSKTSKEQNKVSQVVFYLLKQLKYNNLITLIRLFILIDCLLLYAFIQVFSLILKCWLWVFSHGEIDAGWTLTFSSERLIYLGEDKLKVSLLQYSSNTCLRTKLGLTISGSTLISMLEM